MSVLRRHHIMLVTLLTVAGFTDTSLAQTDNYRHNRAASGTGDNALRVCIDNQYRITPCQALTAPLNDSPVFIPVTSSRQPGLTDRNPFILIKRKCGHGSRREYEVLRSLFPGIPDFQLKLNKFSLDIDVPREIEDLEQSTINVGYRNCW